MQIGFRVRCCASFPEFIAVGTATEHGTNSGSKASVPIPLFGFAKKTNRVNSPICLNQMDRFQIKMLPLSPNGTCSVRASLFQSSRTRNGTVRVLTVLPKGTDDPAEGQRFLLLKEFAEVNKVSEERIVHRLRKKGVALCRAEVGIMKQLQEMDLVEDLFSEPVVLVPIDGYWISFNALDSQTDRYRKILPKPTTITSCVSQTTSSGLSILLQAAPELLTDSTEDPTHTMQSVHRFSFFL